MGFEKNGKGLDHIFDDFAEMVNIFDWGDGGVKRREIVWASIDNQPHFDTSIFSAWKNSKALNNSF